MSGSAVGCAVVVPRAPERAPLENCVLDGAENAGPAVCVVPRAPGLEPPKLKGAGGLPSVCPDKPAVGANPVVVVVWAGWPNMGDAPVGALEPKPNWVGAAVNGLLEVLGTLDVVATVLALPNPPGAVAVDAPNKPPPALAVAPPKGCVWLGIDGCPPVPCEAPKAKGWEVVVFVSADCVLAIVEPPDPNPNPVVLCGGLPPAVPNCPAGAPNEAVPPKGCPLVGACPGNAGAACRENILEVWPDAPNGRLPVFWAPIGFPKVVCDPAPKSPPCC